MDMEIIRDLFAHTIAAAEILGKDEALRGEIAKARARLAPCQIGKAGQLQEWLEDLDMQAGDLHHRHVSHLYGFFPSAQISLRGTPELAAAVRRSLEIRGDNATGWGLGWRLNLWARQQDAEHTYRILQSLAASRPHLSEHVRRPSALPDRRQFRRHRRHRRDALAKPCRRDRASARAAQGLAQRLGQGSAGPRRF